MFVWLPLVLVVVRVWCWVETSCDLQQIIVCKTLIILRCSWAVMHSSSPLLQLRICDNLAGHLKTHSLPYKVPSLLLLRGIFPEWWVDRRQFGSLITSLTFVSTQCIITFVYLRKLWYLNKNLSTWGKDYQNMLVKKKRRSSISKCQIKSHQWISKTTLVTFISTTVSKNKMVFMIPNLHTIINPGWKWNWMSQNV